MLIAEGTQVTLHFALHLADGAVVDSNFADQPATLVVGDGNLPEGFEQCLLGLQAGDERSFTVPPEAAFGLHQSDNVQSFRRHQFGVDVVLEPGVVISFTDQAGAELPGVVKQLEGDFVDVDFNHPLAGETLTFKVQIVSVAAGEEAES
jgi:FKBP-type peptidyl-prolyl cis-trans isomerase SlpA